MTETSLQKLEKKVIGFPDQAKLIMVHDGKTLNGANDFLLTIKEMRKQVKETFDPIIEKAHKTHKEAVAQKKKYENPLIDAEKIIKLQIASYMAELERIRREAEEKARKEEEERKKLEEEKLKAVLEAKNSGNIEEAERILNEEIPEPKPFISPPPPPKLEGTGIRKIWKWRVTDKNLIPREYLTVDSTKIGSLVRSTQGQIRIPGIEIYSEDSVTARL